jgi:hypothetical protein
VSAELLERWALLRALPPALPDAVVAEVEEALRSRFERAELDQRITRAVDERLHGDLTSFDRLPEPLRRIALARFEHARSRGLQARGVLILNPTTGLGA